MKRYGKSVFKSIKNCRIVCSGTIWGSTKYMLDFTNTMAKNIESSDWKYYRIYDQAVINCIVYCTDFLRNKTVYFSDFLGSRGEVMTINLNREDVVCENGVIFFKGSDCIPAIVHQYDRHKDIVRHIREKYNPKSAT